MSGFSEVMRRYKALAKKALRDGDPEGETAQKEVKEEGLEKRVLFKAIHVENGERESKVAIAITLIKCARKFFTDDSKFRAVVSDVFNDLSFDDIIDEVRRYNEDLAELIRLYMEVKTGKCVKDEEE